jgi:MFS family permease
VDETIMTDFRLLFGTRITRMFAYGFLSVSLALYLTSIGLSEQMVGVLFTLTLAGDAAISLWLTTRADRFGRRKTLIIGSGLMLMAGIVFALTREPFLLAIAGIIGVVSPSGKEIGPFLSIEQAALTQLIPSQRRTQVFAWYNLAGSFATATGALCGGLLVQGLRDGGMDTVNAYRALVIGYALIGIALAFVFWRMSDKVEAPAAAAAPTGMFGLGQSRNIVLGLSALFALDAFAGGFVIDSFLAYWLTAKFGIAPGALGAVFFATNLLAGISALVAAPMARKFGLINTMVFTHIPSNVLLILVPLMPSLPLAVGMLLFRFAISQMDVPTRQSYTMAVVRPEERSAAGGVTGIARSVGAAISPSLAGPMLASASFLSLPFFIAGGLKIVYDLALYRSFNKNKPPEEHKAG